MEVQIISIGNELLIGRVINTNFSWLARELTALGYTVRAGAVVRDELEDIAGAFREGIAARASVIISTGGLGPTFDDKTSQGLARALNRPWVMNEEALAMVKEKYSKAGLEIPEPGLKMARMPEGARPIPNPVGTAPGILIEEGEGLIIALPGVPTEMKAIFERDLEHLLKKRGPKLARAEFEMRVVGIPESAAAPLIERAMRTSPKVYIKSHPRGREVGGPVLLIHVQASAMTRKEAQAELGKVKEELTELLRQRGGRVELPSSSSRA